MPLGSFWECPRGRGTLYLNMSETVEGEGPAADEATPKVDLPDVDLGVLQETLEYIRPAIQMDGGDLVLLGVDEGTVNLQMVGACGGCPMSMMTLKAGIERILIDRVPGVLAVNAT
jgi:Fe-S cluster biogenesis protein NfuA